MASYGSKRGSGRPAGKKPAAPETAKNSTSTPTSFSSSNRSASVERRAFEIYMKRVSTGAPGNDVGDWLQAESELRSEEE